MKIAIVVKNPFYFPGQVCLPRFSGPSIGFAGPWIKYLLARGHSVALVSPGLADEQVLFPELFPSPPDSPNFKPIFFTPQRVPKVAFQFTNLDVQAAILQAHEEFGGLDIVACIYVFPWLSPINQLKEYLGFPTVAFLRGSDVTQACDPKSNYKDNYPDPETWRRITAVFRSAINHSDLIFSVSDVLKNFSESLGIRVDGILPTPPFQSGTALRSHPNGDQVFKTQFASNPAIARQVQDLDCSQPWIIYLGRFHEEKQVELALRSFMQSKSKEQCTLIVGGDGPDRERVEKYLSHNVKACFVPPDLVPLACKAATVMIHPTLPSAILDARPSSCTNAAYVGCPIIFPYSEGRTTGGAQESVGQVNRSILSFNPFVSKEEIVKEIAAKIDLVIENPAIAQSIYKDNLKFTAQFEPIAMFDALEKQLIALHKK